MTPQDRLKEIEADFKTANPRYNSATMIKSDIKWLIARVKQLQSENTHLKEQIQIAKDALERIKMDKIEVNPWTIVDSSASRIAAQVLEKIAQLNEKKE